MNGLLLLPRRAPSFALGVAACVAAAVGLAKCRAALPIFVKAAVWCFMRASNGAFFPTGIPAGGAIEAAVSWLVTLGLRRIGPVTGWGLEGARLLRLG